ncbi:restriction endonuclease [Burkholderia multivorans]|uniref:restriction endonuclease n=1 Tax=Burkholderia multivorans TaxID=87883 RepID=UPI00280B6836|nr:restriction endonuclease [Burkholderia multivorans]
MRWNWTCNFITALSSFSSEKGRRRSLGRVCAFGNKSRSRVRRTPGRQFRRYNPLPQQRCLPRPTAVTEWKLRLDKLLGAMTKFNADQGLFVAWGGFKGNVQKQLASQFFRLRLWTQKELLEQLFEQYERLDEDLKAELPLKRVWMVASQEHGF